MTTRWPTSTIDAAGFAAIAALGVTVYLSGYAPMRRAQASATASQDTLNSRREESKALTHALRETRASVQTRRRALDAMPPLATLSDQPRRVGQLGQMAKDHAIDLQELVPRDAKHEAGGVVVPFRVTGSGLIADLRRMLGSLHTTFPDIEVVSLDVSATPDKPGPAPFSLELAWYVLDEQGDRASHTTGAGSPAAGRPESP